MAMTDDAGVFAVVVETKTEGPILLETGGWGSSLGRARILRDKMAQRHDVIRVAVVRIVPERWGGSELLLADMERMQNDQNNQDHRDV